MIGSPEKRIASCLQADGERSWNVEGSDDGMEQEAKPRGSAPSEEIAVENAPAVAEE
jgi:hypothetical protein